jgi:hypothetical protein
MRALLQGVPHSALKGAHVAVFDTRYRMARLLPRSAADWIVRHLASAGAALVVAPESFFVVRDASPSGEQRRHDHERLEVGERSWHTRADPDACITCGAVSWRSVG